MYMKLINKLSVKLASAVVIGFLLASTSTYITYPCPPIDGAVGCTSFQKAVMNPHDLLGNKQNSLVHFSETFVITSLASFALLSVFTSTRKGKSDPANRIKS